MDQHNVSAFNLQYEQVEDVMLVISYSFNRVDRVYTGVSAALCRRCSQRGKSELLLLTLAGGRAAAG